MNDTTGDDRLVALALRGDTAHLETLLDRLRRYQRSDGESLDRVLDLLVGGATEEAERDRFVEVIHRLGLARPAIAQIVTDPTAIDDVEQQTLVAVTRGLASFEGRSRFRTWLYTVARNESLQHLRRNRRVGEQVSLERGAANALDGSSRRVSSMVTNRVVITAAMQRLSAEHREVLWLRGTEGLEYSAIAARLDLNLNTVRTRLRQARLKLAEEMARDESA